MALSLEERQERERIKFARILVNQRMHREGREADFWDKCTKLINAGCPKRDAWRFAVQHYPPQNGDPIEIEIPPPKQPPPIPANWLPPKPPEPKEPKEPKETKAATVSRQKRDAFDEAREVVSGLDLPRSASPREVAEWVFENVLSDIGDLDPADIPSRGALALLASVQMDPRRYEDFIKDVWVKLLPAKSQLDQESRFNDDGRKVLASIDAIEEQFAAEMQRAQETE